MALVGGFIQQHLDILLVNGCMPPARADLRGRLLLAESGLSNLSFAAILVSALPPKADIQLILGERSANDPKRTFFPLLTTQRRDRLVTVRRRGFYV